MRTMRDAGPSYVPPPLVHQGMLDQGWTEAAAGDSSNVGTGSLAAVLVMWKCFRVGGSLQISQVPLGPGWWWHSGNSRPNPESLSQLDSHRTGSSKWDCFTFVDARSRFYQAIIQAIILYGSKLWVISWTEIAWLKGFHILAIFRMTKDHKLMRGPGWEWIYPHLKDVLEECGIKTTEEYILIQ